MTSPGVELATEWVTILPETAELVKRLKKFEPPPIHVKLIVDKQGNAKSVIDEKAVAKQGEKAGEKAGEAIVTGVKKETRDLPKAVGDQAKKAGESMKREIVKPIQKVSEDIEKAVAPKDNGRIRQAASKMGNILRVAFVREVDKAGQEATNKLAQAVERAKGAVTKAERSLADARIAAGNIESRIRQQEERVKQLRASTAEGLKRVAQEEKIYNDMRANAAKHSADDILGQERKLQQMRTAQQNRVVRLEAAEESQGRLLSSREVSANRTANAVDNLGTKEAALASALSLQQDPLEEGNRKLRAGDAAAGGMMASLVPLGKQLLVTTGLFTGAMGLGGAITYTLSTGNKFTDTINKMQGVLGRNADQMGDITGKARELGRDFMLPAVSANDAATSMFELTKAGFTAQQAMDAARGSLQLSAAAGIDAAEASYITGTALNAFGLQATDAAKITDILANAANLFPGEMTDFGYSLSQAGAVAKSFGIDIEDTTTALGFLAKAGIKSSDAGTLIKTMLLSLTDSGKPAQEAIRTLGLELYNQDGTFKGLEYVYKRLNAASREMTQEQYQAATATLFGTDAARFAGLAAGEAAPNWDEFRDKIDQAGTAANVANARMQGLPGAMERLKNSTQELALVIFDMVKGPLEAVVNAVARVVLGFSEWLQGPFIGFIRDFKEELIGIGVVLLATAGYMATAFAVTKLMAAYKAIKLIVGVTRGWAAAQLLLNAAFLANPIGLIVAGVAALVAGVIYAYKNVDWFRNGVNAAWSGIKTAFTAAVPVIKGVWDAIVGFAKWTWENGLKPVFNFIKEGWTLVWQLVQVAWRVGEVVFQAVATAVQTMWAKVQPVIDAFGIVWDWISERFTAFKDKIVAGWETIKTVISVVWEWLKPVRDWMGNFFDSIGELGRKAGEAIKQAWSGLKNVLMEPLRALGRFLQGIPSEILGVKIDFVENLHGWGASLAGLRSGGVIKGPGTGTSDSILGLSAAGVPTVRVSNGEGVVPADVLTTPLGKALFSGLLGLAGGGKVPGGRGDGLNPGAAWLKDYIMQNYGITDIGGRRSEDGYGEHSSGNALDIMVGDKAKGDAIAGFLKTNRDNLDIDGMIWQQRSYGYGGSWDGKMMGDRGNATQNHYDHIHVILGKGRGISAGAVGLPSGPIVNPATGASSMAGGDYGSQMRSYSGSGSYVVDPKKVSRAEDRVTDRQNQLDAAQLRLDEQLAKQAAGETVKESTLTNARNQVEKFSRELEQAKGELEEAKRGEYKEDKSSGKSSDGDSKGSGNDWSEVGKTIFSGFLESFGLDGSVFTNLFDTPNVKSGMAALNFGLGLLGAKMQEGQETGSGNGLGVLASGDGGGGLLSGGLDMLAGIGEQTGLQLQQPQQHGQGTGAVGPGGQPVFDMRGSQLGVSPAAFEDKMGEMTAANRRHTTLGPAS